MFAKLRLAAFAALVVLGGGFACWYWPETEWPAVQATACPACKSDDKLAMTYKCRRCDSIFPLVGSAPVCPECGSAEGRPMAFGCRSCGKVFVHWPKE
jgi:hypothetical protein